MNEPDSDPVVQEIREAITEVDRQILGAVNERLELVRRLKRHKDERGYAFVDRSREAWLIGHLVEANPGPLSADGVRDLYTYLLDLLKRELVAGGPSPVGRSPDG